VIVSNIIHRFLNTNTRKLTGFKNLSTLMKNLFAYGEKYAYFGRVVSMLLCEAFCLQRYKSSLSEKAYGAAKTATKWQSSNGYSRSTAKYRKYLCRTNLKGLIFKLNPNQSVTVFDRRLLLILTIQR
jgi:hypothetical protein